MKLRLNNDPEQIELIKALGSRNKIESAEAMEAFAAFLGPVIQKVLLQAGTSGLIYKDDAFDEDDSPSYPLDLYYNEEVGYVTVWSQQIAGGLPSSQVEGVKEMKISTYRLDSAVHFLKKYARKSRLEIISKAVEKMAQEILVKQEKNAWAVILRALGEASTRGTKHTIASDTANVFVVNDLNRLLTLHKRLNVSFAGGTPAGVSSKGVTDLFVSPEIMEQVRAFAFNPMNTRGVPDSAESTALGLPDSIREKIFNAAGASEIYGIVFHELIELGDNKDYNVLFGEYDTTGIAHSGGNFATNTDQILVGVDLSRDAFIRPIARQAESGGTFLVTPDDQWVTRSDKAGFYGMLEEGRVCLDSRAVSGIIV